MSLETIKKKKNLVTCFLDLLAYGDFIMLYELVENSHSKFLKVNINHLQKILLSKRTCAVCCKICPNLIVTRLCLWFWVKMIDHNQRTTSVKMISLYMSLHIVIIASYSEQLLCFFHSCTWVRIWFLNTCELWLMG